MDYFRSDEFMAILVPILVYWIYSGAYMIIDFVSSAERYRLQSKEEGKKKNSVVSKGVVVKGVLLQQTVQATIAFLCFWLTSKDIATTATNPQPSLLVQVGQFLIAMLVFDTWQYFMHRYMHHNKFMYRNVHSWHHRLVVPYAFGAQYNHPVDGILIETVAGALAFFVSGMSPRTSIFFFAFATIKGVDDHCGFLLPWNPFHKVFWNNAAYHDIHHRPFCSKYNYSQSFFVMWDRILGTYIPYDYLEK